MQTPTEKPVTLALVIAASRVMAALQPLQSAGSGANLLPALAALDTASLSADLAVILGTSPGAVQAMPLPQLVSGLADFVRDLPAYVAGIGQVDAAMADLTSALDQVAASGALPDLKA